MARPESPVRVSWTDVSNSDLAVQDSFLYTASSESLVVFNIATKSNPQRVGAVADSGEAIAVAGGKAYLTWGTFGWHGMYILDVSDPRAPHRVGVWNSTVGSIAARGNLCYVSDAGRMRILDMSNPASPQELSSVGVGGNIYLDGNFVFLSTFAIVDVTDSLSPGIVGQCTLAPSTTAGVWATGLAGRAFVSCYSDGMAMLDLSDPVHPVLDSIGILAHADSRDISVQSGHALVDNNSGGARLLNVVDPSHPFEIASYDTTGEMPYSDAAQLRGSVAYLAWYGWDGWHGLYVVSFADSTHPVQIGKCPTFWGVEAIALSDSFLYAAEGEKFQVISIMDSTRPVVVSTCSLGSLAQSRNVCLIDSIAYVANSSGGLRLINVARPHNAVPLSSYVPPQTVWGIDVKDSIAYVGTAHDLRLVNVKNPLVPFEIGVFPTQGAVTDVQVKGDSLILKDRFTVLDVSDPAHLRQLGYYDPPGLPRVGGFARLCLFERLRRDHTQVHGSQCLHGRITPAGRADHSPDCRS